MKIDGSVRTVPQITLALSYLNATTASHLRLVDSLGALSL
jgi:hypothetical protein